MQSKTGNTRKNCPNLLHWAFITIGSFLGIGVVAFFTYIYLTNPSIQQAARIATYDYVVNNPLVKVAPDLPPLTDYNQNAQDLTTTCGMPFQPGLFFKDVVSNGLKAI